MPFSPPVPYKNHALSVKLKVYKCASFLIFKSVSNGIHSCLFEPFLNLLSILLIIFPAIVLAIFALHVFAIVGLALNCQTILQIVALGPVSTKHCKSTRLAPYCSLSVRKKHCLLRTHLVLLRRSRKDSNKSWAMTVRQDISACPAFVLDTSNVGCCSRSFYLPEEGRPRLVFRQRRRAAASVSLEICNVPFPAGQLRMRFAHQTAFTFRAFECLVLVRTR